LFFNSIAQVFYNVTTYIVLILTALGAYLIGSVPFAVMVSKFMRLPDPRRFGSRNPGATNVLRSGNKIAAALTLLGDVLKGVLAVLLSKYIGIYFQSATLFAAIGAVAVFFGHLFPLFLNFKGGKGVATALGVLCALHPFLALCAVLCWLLIAYSTKYSSLSAIVTALLIPVIYIVGANHAWPASQIQGLAIIVISIALLVKHKTNIQRLLQGKETKIGQSSNR